MKLGTTTGVISQKAKISKEKYLLEGLRLIKEAGFTSGDLRLSSLARNGYPLAMPGWEKWVDQMAEEIEKLGLDVSQGHSFVYRSAESTDLSIDRAWYEERIRRCILAAGTLGVRWLVVHPLDFHEDKVYDYEKNKGYNIRYWEPFVALAQKHQVGIAFENLFPSGHLSQRYCSQVEDLIELADAYNSPYVGICWDTGHAGVAGQDQYKSIKKAGKRIKALHLHDNHLAPKGDEHLLPHFGKVPWEEVYQALAEIDYQGVVALEVKEGILQSPPPLTPALLAYMKNIGEYIINQIALVKKHNEQQASLLAL